MIRVIDDLRDGSGMDWSYNGVTKAWRTGAVAHVRFIVKRATRTKRFNASIVAAATAEVMRSTEVDSPLLAAEWCKAEWKKHLASELNEALGR